MNPNKDFYFRQPFTNHFCAQLWVLKDFKKFPKDYDIAQASQVVLDNTYNIVHVFLIGLRNGKCYDGKEKIQAYLKELMELTENKNFKDSEGNNYLHVLAYYIRDGVYMDYANGSKHSYNSNLKALAHAYEFFSENYPDMNIEENQSKFLPGDYLLKKFKQDYQSKHNTFKFERDPVNYYSVINLYQVANVRESLTVRSRLSLKDKLKYFDNLIDHCSHASKEGTLTGRQNMKELLTLLVAVKEKNNLNRMMEQEPQLSNEHTQVQTKVKKQKI
jgi:hypothetical protein